MYLLSDSKTCWVVVNGPELRDWFLGLPLSGQSYWEPARDIFYLHADSDAGMAADKMEEGIVTRQINDFDDRIRRHNLVRLTLESRKARCASCKWEVDSTRSNLAFFEYRGPGSRDSVDSCKHCRYAKVAHKPNPSRFVCSNFEADPQGREVDLFYCGCRGWD